MRKPPSLKAQPGEMAKPSVVDLTVLLVLGLLAGVGAGLAFESDALGLAVAAFASVAVAAYAAATHLDHRPRERREPSRSLSVTEISARRRGAPGRVQREPAPPPEPDAAADVGKIVDPERVVPFRAPSAR